MTDAAAAGELERIPCLDDMCVGIIGADGRCGTCGKPGDRVPTAAFAVDPDPEPAPADAADTDDADRGAAEGDDVEGDGERRRIHSATAGFRAGASSRGVGGSALGAAGAPDVDEERVPCPDDMCVGIVGPNGRCGTCGRSVAAG